MTSNEFYLKLKTNDKNFELRNTIQIRSTLEELRRKISEVTGISVPNLKILFGYPRKPLSSVYTQTLDECGIECGDTLFVEEKESSPSSIEDMSCTPTDVSLTGTSLLHITDNSERNGAKGIFLKKEVPSDNSCLFTSINFSLTGKIDSPANTYMRQLVASIIASQADEYNDAILGKPNEEYCKWILNPNSWGGAIELAVLSNYYGFEIAVLNSTTGLINIFGEDKQYDQRVFLLFDGIHYDPLYMYYPEISKIQTIFPTNDRETLEEAQQLAVEAKNSRQYTDVNQFMVCCADCNSILVGQLQAQKHAEQTGHTSFNEVPN